MKTLKNILALTTAAALLMLSSSVRADLVGRWPFDEGQGTNAVDVTTNGNNGVLWGCPLPIWPNGVSGSALAFDGVQNEVLVPSAPVLTPANGLTVATWIAAATNTTGVAIAKWDNLPTPGSYMLTLSNGAPAFQLSLNSTVV